MHQSEKLVLGYTAGRRVGMFLCECRMSLVPERAWVSYRSADIDIATMVSIDVCSDIIVNTGSQIPRMA